MKRRRHEAILNLIEKYNVTTQEELLYLLKENGFDVTQATVSRDIKELRLIKAMDAENNYRYVTMTSGGESLSPKFINIFASAVISIDSAVNDVVIHCYSGMANAACAALDSMNWSDVVGSLAGDDTIFVITRSEQAASHLAAQLNDLL